MWNFSFALKLNNVFVCCSKQAPGAGQQQQQQQQQSSAQQLQSAAQEKATELKPVIEPVKPSSVADTLKEDLKPTSMSVSDVTKETTKEENNKVTI